MHNKLAFFKGEEDTLVQYLKIKNKIFNVEVIPYAANLESFYPLPKDKNKQTFDILFIGQLSLRKGLPYLLDAFNKFKHPFKKLHLIGLKTEDFSLFEEKNIHWADDSFVAFNSVIRNFEDFNGEFKMQALLKDEKDDLEFMSILFKKTII